MTDRRAEEHASPVRGEVGLRGGAINEMPMNERDDIECALARPRQTYIIASSPRTGSYLLSEGLEATGEAGSPSEIFNPYYRRVFLKRWSLREDMPFSSYFNECVRRGTTPNGVFGFKIHWFNVDDLAREIGFGNDAEGVLERLFPHTRYIYIRRRDRRAQAISFYRARATNEWWKIDGVVNDQVTGRTPAFDAAAISELEIYLAKQETEWQAHFRRLGREVLTVEYEDLVGDYRSVLARALQFLGLDANVAEMVPEPRLVRQADDVSLEWRHRLDMAGAER